MVIYQIKNLLNNKFYIGKTIDPKDRFYKHKYNSFKKKSQTYLHRAMRKYGEENFEFTILEELDSLDDLNEREIYWIDQLKPAYNMTKGGDGGDTSNSPNYKKAMQQRDMTGPKNGMFGKKRTIPKQQLENAQKAAKIANSCTVSCDGQIFNSIGEAQIAYPGISIRKRLDSDKYPTFFRLKPKINRR